MSLQPTSDHGATRHPAVAQTTDVQRVRIAIVGAGFGGLGAAIKLKQAGIHDFVILERAGDVGGTWQANHYPGAQCDIPSVLYSFSFAPNPAWTRMYPLQEELHAYLRGCAEKFGITPHLRLNHEVLDASWDEDAQLWRLQTAHGTFEAPVLISANGPFSEPSVPDLPGLDSFQGTVFHSAAWNHEHDLTGERVAVIGTGASAVQFIPRIQPKVGKMTVFQRTPTWILPHPDQPTTAIQRHLFRRLPLAQKAVRTGWDAMFESMVPGFVYQPALNEGMALLGRAHLRRQVSDPELRAKLTPRYAFGCKRPTFSNAYYPALAQPNAEVVASGIKEVREHSIVAADGSEHEVDTIILGTGFKMTDHPFMARVHGRGGRTMAQAWDGDPRAYLGTTVAGFPNLFMILGPNAGVYTSAVTTIEQQVGYILDCLKTMDAQGLASIEVRPEVQESFVERLDAGLRNSVWISGGCSSYYLSPTGRNFTHFPGFSWQFKRLLRRATLADFRTRRTSDVPVLRPSTARSA